MLCAGDYMSMTSKFDLAAGVYYLGVTCTNVKKYETEYSIKIGDIA